MKKLIFVIHENLFLIPSHPLKMDGQRPCHLRLWQRKTKNIIWITTPWNNWTITKMEFPNQILTD